MTTQQKPEEDRKEWAASAAERDHTFHNSIVEYLLRDFDREHARANSLAAEVERLKAEYLTLGINQSARVEAWKDVVREQSARAEKAEAELARLKAPLADGEVEKAVEIIEVMLVWASPASTLMSEIKNKHSQTVGVLRRLSIASKAKDEALAEVRRFCVDNAALARKGDSGFDLHEAMTYEAVIAAIDARAALSPAPTPAEETGS